VIHCLKNETFASIDNCHGFQSNDAAFPHQMQSNENFKPCLHINGKDAELLATTRKITLNGNHNDFTARPRMI